MHAMGSRDRASRRFRTPGTDFNDSVGYGPWPATLSDRERRPRSRNRRPDGDRDPRRFGNLYYSEPLGATDPRVATRKLREDCWCQGRLTLLKKRYECHIP